MKTSTIAVALVLLVVVIGGVYFLISGDDSKDSSDNGDDTEKAEQVTVTDVLGRQVVVDTPVKSVAFGDCTVIDIFAPAVGENWADFAGMWPADFKSREPGKEKVILEDHPELAKLPTVPDMFALLMSGQQLPVDEILAADPDLFIMPSPMFSMLEPNMRDSYLDNFTKAGIPVLCVEIYDKAFEPDIAEKTYGNIGKIMGTEETADKIIKFYNDSFKALMDKVNPVKKSFNYMVEMAHPDPQDSNVANLLAWTVAKELEILGGENVCKSMAESGSWNYEKTKSVNNGRGPDYIMVADTPYYGNPQYLGHGITELSPDVDKYFQDMCSRPGYDDLDAIEKKNLLLAYGETRNSMFGLADIYNVAQFIYPETVTDADIDKLYKELDALCPFGFNGIFAYHYTGA